MFAVDMNRYRGVALNNDRSESESGRSKGKLSRHVAPKSGLAFCARELEIDNLI
jgi:hypothetical protein